MTQIPFPTRRSSPCYYTTMGMAFPKYPLQSLNKLYD